MGGTTKELAFVGTEHFRRRGIIQQYGAVLVRLGVLIDSAIILTALYLVSKCFNSEWTERHLVIAAFGIFCFATLASFSNLYRSWRLIRLREELAEILVRWTASSAILTTALFFIMNEQWSPDRRILLYWYVVSFIVIIAFRIAMRLVLRYYRAFGHDHRSVAFIGATTTADRLSQIFQANPWMGIDVVGCYDDPGLGHYDRDQNASSETSRNRIAGNLDDLIKLTGSDKVDAIYITLPMSAEKIIKETIDRFSDSTVSIYYCPNLMNFDPVNARWDDVFGQPVISVVESPFGGYERYLKRLEDIGLTVLVLPVIFIPLVVIAILIKATSPGPIFYSQNRHGLNRRVFRILKFRTMYVAESDHEFVQAKREDARITPLGSFLRKASLDELPQFFNVLKGDMSIVGPRPHPTLLNEQHRKLIHRYTLRHKVKPGITGWAQVNGYRGETETLVKMEKRIEHDLDYIRNWSIWLDLKVLCLTLLRPFERSDSR